MCAGRVAACEVFWGLGFRKIPSGAAVVVKAATKCQYYFFKFLKNVLCCDCGAEHASKQILHSLQALQHEHSSRLLLAASKMAEGAGRNAAWQRSRGFVVYSATATAKILRGAALMCPCSCS